MITKLYTWGVLASAFLTGASAQSNDLDSGPRFNENLLSRQILEQIKQNRKLVVLTRNAPTTYYENENGPEGFEYRLTQMLGKALQVDVEYVVYNSNEEIVQALNEGRGHIAAAGLSKTENREKLVRFGPEYKTVQQQVVCNRNIKQPKSPYDLAKVNLQVVAGSSYDEKLQTLQKQIPNLHWQATRDESTEELLKDVWQGELDCTVADSNVVEINRRYFPELQVAFSFPKEQELAWAIPKHADSLAAYLENWFRELEKNRDLSRLDEDSYGFTKYFDFRDHLAFSAHIDKKLPKYKRLFKKAADAKEIPWTLVAAVAYQESHWQSDAKYAGASGLMMLTAETAEELHVRNRMDPAQNVHGGARYLQYIFSQLPQEIQGEDRYWMALAAYNAGLGHLLDAFKLTKQMGRNPNYWADVKAALPLLSQAKYYRKLKHGYAKGPAIVRYVQKIRDYHDVLEKRAALRGV